MISQVSAAFYRSLFDTMFDALAYCQLLFDAQGNPTDFKYIKVNKNYEKVTGLADLVGKTASETMPEMLAANPELLKRYSEVALTGVPKRFETYFAPLGKWFLVSVYQPREKYFVTILQDVTDRKQTEKNFEDAKVAARNVLEDLSIEKTNLERSKAKEEAILLSVGEGLLATDENGRILHMNAVAEELLGKKSVEVLGKKYSEIFQMVNESGTAIPLDRRPIQLALGAGTTTTTTTTGPALYFVRDDKTKFPVSIVVTPVLLGGKAVGTIEVFRDITREKEIDTAKTEFVSLASHQLRTPLSAVSWYTEMLLAGDAGKLNAEQEKYLQEVYRGNRRMVELVSALLNVSRLELGTFLIEPEPTNVAEIVQRMVDEQKPQITVKHLVLRTDFDKDLPLIQADPKLLCIVVQNLLSNAVKYTPEKGAVSLSLKLVKRNATMDGRTAQGDCLVLVVSDTGYGIPRAQRGKIFEKLFRADNVREKDTEGTGLGLYIVKSIMNHSGGMVWFTSEEGKGSSFYVALPLTGMQKKTGTKELE